MLSKGATMTVGEVLSKSPTGMGVRKYNDLFRQVIVKEGRKAFFLTADGRATECPWPTDNDNWGMLLPGKTLESVQCTLNGQSN